MTTSLSEIIKTGPSAVLVDAAGVLYTDLGPTPGVQSAITALSRNCPVFVATNNTNSSPHQIAGLLEGMGLTIPESRILSSGLTLTLPDYSARIVGQPVYTYGYQRSRYYVELAGGVSVDHPDDAALIVLASSTGADNDTVFERVCASLVKQPNRPVWCINPDFYVHTGTGRVPVIGYYADQLHRQTGVPIEWLGKPQSNFSKLIEMKLGMVGIPVTRSVWFFDDNPANVWQLTHDLGISGAVVMDTGLSAGRTVAQLDTEFGAGSGLARVSFLGDGV